MRNTYNFLCKIHWMYCSSWSELHLAFADLFQGEFITRRRKTWNKTLHFQRVLLLWIKAIASFEERRNHNANTNAMRKITASSGQSRPFAKTWQTFQMWLNCGKAQGFLKPQQYLRWHVNPEVATNDCMVSGSSRRLYPKCSSYTNKCYN